MSALPGDWTPPPRSIIGVERVPEEQGGGFTVGCDCATTTQIIIGDMDRLTAPAEASFICDGCGSVHWFTAGPAAEGGEP